MITWNTPAGSLGKLTERVLINIPISASSSVNSPVTYELIAGKLPRGLKLINNKITGSPVEVRKYTESRFVIRARDSEDLEDRTFSLAVDGADIPEWITPEGFLKVGEGEAYFVLDNSRVDFQLEAADTDLNAGDKLEYFLIPQGGELPPGLTLTSTGRIQGFTAPVFALELSGIPTGGYDTSPLDSIPLDYVEARPNGFDTYFYDNQTYDYNEANRVPKKLSRVYNFVVAVSDGANSINRSFRIYVVTEEFLKADNAIVQVDTNVFQADSTSARKPIWITDSNLGRYRANNYITLFLDVYDPPSLEGTITYILLPTNPGTYQLKTTGEIITNGEYEISRKFPFFPVSNYKATSVSDWVSLVPETPSIVPPGMAIDQLTGEIAGRVPYQAAVTKEYQFTVEAINFPAVLSNINYTLVGDWSASRTYAKNQAVRFEGFIYTALVDNRAKIPEDNPEVWFKGVSSSKKTFKVSLIGEIESSIEWITGSNLGTIRPNQPSALTVKAESQLYGNRVVYKLISGTLPPGLNFLPTGDIEGKVKQFADDAGNGLTRFFDRDSSLIDSTGSRSFNTTFDGDETTFDKKFTFTIRASDSLQFAEVDRTFFVTVVSNTTKTFANLYLRALQSKDKRLEWYNLITDANIFRQEDIYRYGDKSFGIQTDLRILVFAGIESQEAARYVQAISRNHYRKRILFGDIKFAKAKDPVTQETVYEVVYVDVVDNFEKNGKSVSKFLELSDKIESKVLVSQSAITVDSGGIDDWEFKVSDSDHQRIYPNSIRNMRRRISDTGERDRELLPLWMRSIQDQATYELGYTKSLILCYCKPGRSQEIINRIKAKTGFASRGIWSNLESYTINDSVEYNGNFYTCIKDHDNIVPKFPDKFTNFWSKNFNFKDIDFVADRYIIDILEGQIEDKYLAFPKRGEKRP